MSKTTSKTSSRPKTRTANKKGTKRRPSRQYSQVPPGAEHLDDTKAIVVLGGRIIFKGDTFEAWQFEQRTPGAVMFERKAATPLACAQLESEPPKNPVAAAVNTMSEKLERRILSVLDDEAIGIPCNHMSRGTAWEVPPEAGDDESKMVEMGFDRTATNEEAAEWHFTFEVGGWLDACKDLPEQTAAWCRRKAKDLVDAAKAIEKIQDRRNIKVIQTIVSDPGFLPDILAKDMKVTESGDVEPDDMAEWRRERAAKDAAEKQASQSRRVDPIQILNGIVVKSFAVVDCSRMNSETTDIRTALAFAAGRGGDSIVIGVPTVQEIEAVQAATQVK